MIAFDLHFDGAPLLCCIFLSLKANGVHSAADRRDASLLTAEIDQLKATNYRIKGSLVFLGGINNYYIEHLIDL